MADTKGLNIAFGISNYAASDIGKTHGLRSDRIAETLCYLYVQQFVHRKHLVLVSYYD